MPNDATGPNCGAFPTRSSRGFFSASGRGVGAAPAVVPAGAGAGSGPSTISGAGVLVLALSSTSISSATPGTATATLTDAAGKAIAGQVITFDVTRSLAVTSVKSALTDSAGRAVVILTPASPTGAGADDLVASAAIGGTVLTASKGFQIQSTNVSIDSFTSAVPALSAYGQTNLSLSLSGVSVGSPVQIGVTSACVDAGKAVLSPATFTATSNVVTLQYRDNGCGVVSGSAAL